MEKIIIKSLDNLNIKKIYINESQYIIIRNGKKYLLNKIIKNYKSEYKYRTEIHDINELKAIEFELLINKKENNLKELKKEELFDKKLIYKYVYRLNYNDKLKIIIKNDLLENIDINDIESIQERKEEYNIILKQEIAFKLIDEFYNKYLL